MPSSKELRLSDYNLGGFKEEILTTKDGLEILSWYKKTNLQKKVILYFHGNGGSLFDRIERYDKFGDKYNVLALSYRGYSGNLGSPSEEGLILDSMAAYEFLRNQGFKDKDIILYGESLGTGLAVNLAQNKDFYLLVLESAYSSTLSVAKNRYPIFPVSLLMKDKFRSDLRIINVNSPILMIHGDSDKVINLAEAKKLYSLAKSPKKFVEVKGASHVNFSADFLMLEIDKFILNNIK